MFHPYPDDRTNAILRAQGYVSLNPLFLDTETTGLSEMDEICEIAIVDLAGQVLVNSLVKPTKPVSHSTTEIHGISNEMVQDAPTFRDLLPELDRILMGRTVLVYNLEFDAGKLARSASANRFEFGPEDDKFSPWWMATYFVESTWHCAMELYAAYYGDWNDYHGSYRWQRLSTALRQCEIDPPTNIHRAHADAEMTRRLVLHMATGQLTLPPTSPTAPRRHGDANPNEEGESNDREQQ